MNKSERQLNLIFLLLNSKRGVTRQKIRTSISDYFDSTSEASFERMFERDKQDIKNLGFEIAVVQEDFAGSDEILYKIDKSLSLLNFDHFNLTERLLLQVARNIISNTNSRYHSAVLKLESDSELLSVAFILNDLQFMETALGTIIEAIDDQRKITFQYQGSDNSSQLSRRTVTPLKLVIRSGDIYLVAFCHERNDYRTFRSDRISDFPEMGTVDKAVYSLDKVDELERYLDSQQHFGEYLLKLKPSAKLLGSKPKGIVISEFDEVTKIEFYKYSQDELIEFIAFNLPNIELIHSQELLDYLRLHFKVGKNV